MKRQHYEVLVIVETPQDLDVKVKDLEHKDEFQEKMVVPFRSGQLRKLARYLVGMYAPDEVLRTIKIRNPKTGRLNKVSQSKPFVEWQPEAAVCAILACQRYFPGEIEREVVDVIENELRPEVMFWDALEKAPFRK